MRALILIILICISAKLTAGPAKSPKRSVTRDLYSIHSHDCTEFKRGSVAYRGCRGAEWRRLQELCTALQRDDHPLAGQYCAAADRYQILD
jgi:hypothetical protein